MKRNWGRLALRIFLFIAMVSAGTGSLIYGHVGAKMFHHWLKTDPVFSIDTIEVVGNDLVNAEEIIILAGLQKGDNILTADIVGTRERMSLDRRFDRVFLTRHFPDTIQIHIRERKLVALVKLDRLYGVDSNAEIIPLPAAAHLPDLPVITGVMTQQEVKVDQRSAGRQLFESIRDSMLTNLNLGRAIYIVEMIKHFSPVFLDRISEIHVAQPHDPVIYTVEDGLSIRFGVGRYPHKINLLNQTLQRLKKDGIKTRVIDLRFKDQVIVRPIVTAVSVNKKT